MTFRLRTLDPDDPDVSDLEPLRDLVGASRVVAIGESAHGVHEFYRLRDRLVRFLVAELGFTALVLESGFPEGLAIDDWVLGGEGNLEQLSRTNIGYGLGGFAEMRDLLCWIRERNDARKPAVHVYGMDLPGSAGFPGPAIAACLERLSAEPGDAELLRLGSFGAAEEGQGHARARYAAMPAADRHRLAAGIARLVERARAAGDEIALRCALSARSLRELLTNQVMTGSLFRTGQNPRDQSMADNVGWILRREQRIVVAAHNLHIQRIPYPPAFVKQDDVTAVPTLGSCLSADLGDDLVVIATTYRHGRLVRFAPNDRTPQTYVPLLQDLPAAPPDSLDAVMDGLGDLSVLDLRRNTGITATVRSQLSQHEVLELDVTGAYDAVVHVRDVRPVAGFDEVQRRRWLRA